MMEAAVVVAVLAVAGLALAGALRVRRAAARRAAGGEAALDVVMLPDWRQGNPYQSLLGQALGRRGVAVSFRAMPRGLLALNRLPEAAGTTRVFHLHWIDDLVEHVLWSRSRPVVGAKLALLALDVALMRLRGHRVVWTVHNLVSHESRDAQRESRACAILARTCSAVVVHSEGAQRAVEQSYRVRLGARAAIVPHGNYDGVYRGTDLDRAALRQRYGVPEKSLAMLFFGAVRAYKGVDGLLDAMRGVGRDDLCLVVAGRPWTEEVERGLRARAAGDPRIVLRLGTVADEDVAPLHAACDVVVIPFARTLTSGSVALALTLGKPLILPEQARILGIVDERSTHFFADFRQLDAILRTLDARELARMGSAAGARAGALSWDASAARLCAVYAGRRPPLAQGDGAGEPSP